MGKINCTVRGEGFPWDSGESDMPVIPPAYPPRGKLLWCAPSRGGSLGWAEGEGTFCFHYEGFLSGICSNGSTRYNIEYTVTRDSGNNNTIGVFGIDGSTCGLVYYDRCYIVQFPVSGSPSVLKEYVMPKGPAYVFDTEYGYSALTLAAAECPVYIIQKSPFQVIQFRMYSDLHDETVKVIAIGDGYVAMQGNTGELHTNIYVYKFSDGSLLEIPSSYYYIDNMMGGVNVGWVANEAVMAYYWSEAKYNAGVISFDGSLSNLSLPAYSIYEYGSLDTFIYFSDRAFFDDTYNLPVYYGSISDGDDQREQIATSIYAEKMYNLDLWDMLFFPSKQRCILSVTPKESDDLGSLLVFDNIPAFGNYSCQEDSIGIQSDNLISVEAGSLSFTNMNLNYAIEDAGWTEATTSDPLTFT